MAPLTRLGHKRKEQASHNFEMLNELPISLSKKKSRKSIKNSTYNSYISNELTPHNVRGLINLGASCYINSVMQAFIHTPPLRNYFLSNNHVCNEGCESVCQMCALSQIFGEYYSGSAMPPMALHRLLYLVWLEAPCLAGPEQQDANEFYMTYLQLLHNSCLKTPDKHLCSFDGITNATPCRCIIDQVYAGILESNLMCLNCKNNSSKREVFYDVSLELDAEAEDLYNCLQNYTKPEILDESCEIYCNNCASNQAFVKSLSLAALPNVLNINLKRFTQKESRQLKLTNHVMFPFELNMKEFSSKCSCDAKDELFSLLAVISHTGTLNSGHYIVYVKQNQDVWLLCNDHKIEAVAPDIVLSTEAYILIYQRNSVN